MGNCVLFYMGNCVLFYMRNDRCRSACRDSLIIIAFVDHCLDSFMHRVQGRMISVDNFFVFLEL